MTDPFSLNTVFGNRLTISVPSSVSAKLPGQGHEDSQSSAGATVQRGGIYHARPSVSGEMYRSKVWRTRLDATTNWAVVTTGVAVSVAFSSPGSSPLPLVLVVLLDLVFLAMEARRYRYFDIWRTRVRMMEVSMYSPLLRLKGVRVDDGWNEALALDYEEPHFNISMWEALGRRLRRNYSFLFLIQGVSYVAKNMHSPNAGHGARATVGARGSWPGSWRDRVDHKVLFSTPDLSLWRFSP